MQTSAAFRQDGGESRSTAGADQDRLQPVGVCHRFQSVVGDSPTFLLQKFPEPASAGFSSGMPPDLMSALPTKTAWLYARSERWRWASFAVEFSVCVACQLYSPLSIALLCPPKADRRTSGQTDGFTAREIILAWIERL
jgi:hypothetical protein